MTAVSRAQSLRRGGPLPRLWIDSSLSSYRKALCSPMSSMPSSHASDGATVTDTPFSPEAFHVLCIYDFDAEDPDQLSFRKNEVLNVVKREETGWWAAIRPGDDRVGWIPSAFVEPISEAVIHKPYSSSNEPRIHDGIARKVVCSPGGERNSRAHNDALETSVLSPNWLSPLDDDQAPVIKLFRGTESKDASFVLSPLVPPPEGVDVEFELFPVANGTARMSLGTYSTTRETVRASGQYPSSRSETDLVPSNHRPGPNMTEHARSHSVPASPTSPAVSRLRRRRPVLIDDRSSLSRLSTLFESGNVEELDSILSSPAIADSLDAFSGASRGSSQSPGGISPIGRPNPAAGLDALTSPPGASPVEDTELQLKADGSVVAGSLRALLDRLTDTTVGRVQQLHFQRIFLSTFKTFATVDEVFISLLSRFYISEQEHNIRREQRQQLSDQVLVPTQRQVLDIFKLWYQEYGVLRDDPHIAHRLKDFLVSINITSPFAATAREMLESIKNSASVELSPVVAPIKRKRRKVSKGDFIRMDPSLVAQHLCLYEHRLYVRLHSSECLNWAKRCTADKMVNLLAFQGTRHKLAAWVKTSIISTEAFSRKAETLDFWIKVAEACMNFANFSSMRAITAELNDPAIAGQQLLWARVPRGTRLDALTPLDVRQGGGHTYCSVQESVDGPCIPSIETYLADLLNTNEEMPDSVVSRDGSLSLINFAKREKWHHTVEAMLRYQAHSYSFSEDSHVMELIESCLGNAGTGNRV